MKQITSFAIPCLFFYVIQSGVLIKNANATPAKVPFTEVTQQSEIGNSVQSESKLSSLSKTLRSQLINQLSSSLINSADIGTETELTYALVLGDVDGDGDADLLVGNNGSNEANSLYLNNGNGGFNDTGVAIDSDGDSTWALALGDVDGDGDLDLVAGNFGHRNKLYLNNGSGVFNAVGLNIGNETDLTTAIALADIDGDDDLDILTGNFDDTNKLYLNDGNGGYSAAGVDIGTETERPLALELGDVDGDGDLDFLVGNIDTFGFVNKLYFNNGSGSFSSEGVNIGSDTDDTYALTLGDVDADGDLDVIAGNDLGTNKLYLNDGNGGFSLSGMSIGSEINRTRGIELGDVDRDGDIDVVVGNRDQTTVLYLNDGTGTFGNGEVISTDTDTTWALLLGDIDKDGYLDVLTGNYDQTNKLYLSPASIADEDDDGMSDAYELANGLDSQVDDTGLDFDSDGLTNLEEFVLGTLANDTDTDEDGVSDFWDSAPLDSSEGVAMSLDTDDNTFQEVVEVGTRSSENVAVLLDTESGSEVSEVGLPSWFTASSGQPISDVSSDGVWDILVLGETTSGGKTWRLHDGRTRNVLHTHSYPSWLQPTTQKQALRIADGNGNGREELVLLVEKANGVDAYMVYDLGTRNLLKALLLPGWFDALQVVELSDWTGNGASELAIYGKTTGNQGVWLKYDSISGASLGIGQYPGWFSPSEVYQGADLNSNGTESVITLGETSGGAKLWIAQDGRSGSLVRTVGYPGWLTPHSLTMVADDNGDGLSDVVTLAQTSGGHWIWRRNDVSNASLQHQQEYPGWFTPESIRSFNDTDNNDEPEVGTKGATSGGNLIWLKHDAEDGSSNGAITVPLTN